jgi:hypothetical protein
MWTSMVGASPGAILMSALCQKQTFDNYSINSSARAGQG